MIVDGRGALSGAAILSRLTGTLVNSHRFTYPTVVPIGQTGASGHPAGR